MTLLSPIQFSIHLPPPYLRSHLPQLLPDWTVPVGSVLIVLQRAQLPLTERTVATERQKEQLRSVFLDLGSQIIAQGQREGYRSDCFDPRTGHPIGSTVGVSPLNDVAVVHACLGYPLVSHGGCRGIQHPDWGNAVYPSILVSTASPDQLQRIVASLGAQMKPTLHKALYSI